MFSSLLIMISPVKSLPLTLNLSFTNKSIGALLAQQVEGIEHPIHYLSRLLRDVEMDYSQIKSHFLVLIFVIQKRCSTYWFTISAWSRSPILLVHVITTSYVMMNCSIATATK